MQTLQTLDYWAIAIYMALMAGIGLFLGKFVKNIGDYFKGGNAIPWVSGAISNFMTKFSTFMFVAYAGIAYQHGFVALTLIWSTVLPALVGVAIFAKRWRRAGVMTPMELLERRFSPAVRQVFAWGGVGFKILDNMVRLYALGLFVKTAAGISLEQAILGCGIIVAIYTIAGGLWAVVVTDVVQFIILMVATLILVPLTIKAGGGIANLMQTIPQHFDPFNGPKGMPLYLGVYYLMILVKYSGNWTFIQRFYSVRDERASQKQGLLTAVFFFLFPIIFLFPSIAARAILPGLENPEMAYVSVCLKLLPEGIMGLMVAAMFAATMSVLSGEYNVTAGVLTRDIYERVFNAHASGRQMLWVGRIMTLALGAIVTVGALFVGGFGGAFEANKLFTGLFAIPMTLPLILGVVLKRPRPWGALATVVVGMIIGLVLNATPSVSWEMATFIEIVACVAVFLVSGLVPSPDAAYRERVAKFFRRLATPLTEAEKPVEDPVFMRSMSRLYAVALAVTGGLFMAMSGPSLGQISGRFAFGAGLVCLFFSGLLWYLTRAVPPTSLVTTARSLTQDYANQPV
ncbi:sodium:solute symporter family transporter [Hymenobacter arizonensis]|uniref:Transporter, SSS family n=1 Tax=Hymenobacter arizonensis TaxID=1227077 RepID=A0A1I6BJI0_HYMAR|nr:sodium/solute symporter [Hymenobacter arizonensis]SFQ81071.1 transporter, SSS family [Hymenobacter arizonensis]